MAGGAEPWPGDGLVLLMRFFLWVMVKFLFLFFLDAQSPPRNLLHPSDLLQQHHWDTNLKLTALPSMSFAADSGGSDECVERELVDVPGPALAGDEKLLGGVVGEELWVNVGALQMWTEVGVRSAR